MITRDRNPHIVVVERLSGEVYLFEDSAHASRYLEPTDVANEEYDAFDERGTPCNLFVAEDGGQETVLIQVGGDARADAEDLRSRLRVYFEQHAAWRAEYGTMPLNELVHELWLRHSR